VSLLALPLYGMGAMVTQVTEAHYECDSLLASRLIPGVDKIVKFEKGVITRPSKYSLLVKAVQVLWTQYWSCSSFFSLMVFHQLLG